MTIRYWQGRPLGMLLAAVDVDPPDPEKLTPLLDPLPVGLSTTLVPRHTGTLYLKINDSPAELSDNAGQVEVEIVAQ